MKIQNRRTDGSRKAATGIEGLDELTGGGFPRGRTTLVEGGPGNGKTVLALQALAHGARNGEAGIFVAFEESSERILANASDFGWDLPALVKKKKLVFVDAQPDLDTLHSGTFDLSGLLAALQFQARQIGAQRLVFDAIDVVLALLQDAVAARRELYRLHEWILANRLTALVTSKAGDPLQLGEVHRPMGFLQFMVDCTVLLNHDVIDGVSQRSLRVAKYRGSSFEENESPFLIGSAGLEIAAARALAAPTRQPVSTERISSGVPRLDIMLGGGYYRGSSILLTGFPGTAKSTLGGAFAEAACARGERTLFVSFDTDAMEVSRNLSSVGIRLARFQKSGMLSLVSERTVLGSAEVHFLRIKNMVREQRAVCVVIDPISALAKPGNRATVGGVAERLVDWAKASGITLVCTSLLEESGPQLEGTPLQISTLADTWIHLTYLVHAGERNRGLSVVKSRGTAHSNQVRELVLSTSGVTLADPFVAGGEVLMGTLRWEKEREVQAGRDAEMDAARRRGLLLEMEEAQLVSRLAATQSELAAKRSEKETLARRLHEQQQQHTDEGSHRRELRGGDKG